MDQLLFNMYLLNSYYFQDSRWIKYSAFPSGATYDRLHILQENVQWHIYTKGSVTSSEMSGEPGMKWERKRDSVPAVGLSIGMWVYREGWRQGKTRFQDKSQFYNLAGGWSYHSSLDTHKGRWVGRKPYVHILAISNNHMGFNNYQKLLALAFLIT